MIFPITLKLLLIVEGRKREDVAEKLILGSVANPIWEGSEGGKIFYNMIILGWQDWIIIKTSFVLFVLNPPFIRIMQTVFSLYVWFLYKKPLLLLMIKNVQSIWILHQVFWLQKLLNSSLGTAFKIIFHFELFFKINMIIVDISTFDFPFLT